MQYILETKILQYIGKPIILHSPNGCLSVLFFLPYTTKRLIDSEYQNRVRPNTETAPKHRNGRIIKHRNGTERRLYIHYSDIFVNSHSILGYIVYYVGNAKTKFSFNFETKFDIPNFLFFFTIRYRPLIGYTRTGASCRDVEIFLDMPVIWTDFENHVSLNNEICSRNISFLSVRMKFCQSNPSV